MKATRTSLSHINTYEIENLRMELTTECKTGSVVFDNFAQHPEDYLPDALPFGFNEIYISSGNDESYVCFNLSQEKNGIKFWDGVDKATVRITGNYGCVEFEITYNFSILDCEPGIVPLPQRTEEGEGNETDQYADNIILSFIG